MHLLQCIQVNINLTFDHRRSAGSDDNSVQFTCIVCSVSSAFVPFVFLFLLATNGSYLTNMYYTLGKSWRDFGQVGLACNSMCWTICPFNLVRVHCMKRVCVYTVRVCLQCTLHIIWFEVIYFRWVLSPARVDFCVY